MYIPGNVQLLYMVMCCAEFHGQVQVLMPMLQEYTVLVWQEFGEKQQVGAKGLWHHEEQRMSEELDDNHKEMVSIDPPLSTLTPSLSPFRLPLPSNISLLSVSYREATKALSSHPLAAQTKRKSSPNSAHRRKRDTAMHWPSLQTLARESKRNSRGKRLGSCWSSAR